MNYLRFYYSNLTVLFTKNKTMTRILLSLLVSLTVFSASAQFKKGDILLGADLSFSGSKSTSNINPGDQKSSYGDFGISIGKAIKENAIAGIKLGYGHNSNTYNNGTDNLTSSNNTYSIGVFYRLYKNLGKDFYLFGEAGAEYNGSTSSTSDTSGSKVTGNAGVIYITPGLAYRISSKVFVEFSIPAIFNISYSSSSSKLGSQTLGTSDNFGASANIISNPLSSLGIGFRLIL
jgi:Outer membrane protein beta-barrel domain